jgi:peptide/nickel transport system substrate-binding protein
LHAAALLDAAGYPDPDGIGPQPRFRLQYKTTTADLRRRIAEAIQAQLGAIGVGLEIESNEWATFYGDVRAGRFTVFSLAWVGIQDPDIYYRAFHSTQQPPQGSNRGGFADPLIDYLTERARRCTSDRQRQRLYTKVQQRLRVLLPVVPLWWTSNTVVSHRRVHGYHLPPEGGYGGLRHAWIENDGSWPDI